VGLLLVVCAQGIAPLGYLRAALLELFERYDSRLVGIHEPRLLPRETPQVTLELLRFGLLFVVVCGAGVGELLEVGK